MYRKAEIKQDADMAIRQAGVPVDQVTAAVMARSSAPYWFTCLMAVAAGVGWYQFASGINRGGGFAAALAVILAYNAVLAWLNAWAWRPVLVARTRTQLICCRVRRWRWQPAKAQVLFSAPSAEVRMSVRTAKTRRIRRIDLDIRLRRPGAEGRRPPQLWVVSARRAELDEVMAALTGLDAHRATLELHPSPASAEPRITGPADL